MERLDVKKTKYFVIAIIILILLSVILIVHFNNKELVSGDVDDNTTKETITTTTTTTTKVIKKDKKDKKQEEVVEELSNTEELEEVVYKSSVDENNNIIYNYKLTDEITDKDMLISTKLNVDSNLLNSNILSLYDISLYDVDMNKKSVSNSLITIKIPISNELIGYDEYKIVYIDENKQITDEKFDVKIVNNYIEFNTTHLSMFGVVGIKKVLEDNIVEDKEEIKEEVDLSNLQVSFSINDTLVTDVLESHILLSKSDKVSVSVENVSNDYKVYYSLKNDKELIDYKLFNDNILNDIKNGNKYTLTIKVVVGDISKEVIIGNISVYDIVFAYDKEEVVTEEEVIGTIYNEDNTIYKNEDGSDYKYIDTEINQDIVIDNIETTENIESSLDEISDGQNSLTESNEELDNKASIKVNGNIYLVEETDISKLEMTGYLIIDTDENIVFAKDYNDKLLTSNLYTITIRSKEFTLNGVKYRYEIVEDKLVIKKVEEVTENEIITEKETDVTDTFTDIFANEDYKAMCDKNGLLIASPYN